MRLLDLNFVSTRYKLCKFYDYFVNGYFAAIFQHIKAELVAAYY